MFDVIIIWAGASGLFCWMLLPKDKKKLILEKTGTIGSKVLLSGKGRCNFTNTMVGETHYLGDQGERLDQLFKLFWAQEMIKFLTDNGIESKEEENGRILLKSNKSRQLVDFFIQKNHENGTKIQTETEVLAIEKEANHFLIRTKTEIFTTKKVILASGGCSFPKIWASEFAFSFANHYQLKTKKPQAALCGITVQEKLDQLSWSSVFAKIQVLEKEKMLLKKEGTVLFTHWGISGPVIFNTSLWLGYHYEKNFKNLRIKLTIPADQITKRLLSYLKAPKGLKNYILTLRPTNLRSRDEAKVMSGGILFEEVNDHFEVKKMPWAFVLGEALNITGETWGFNLQWCWTSAFCCSDYMK